MIKSISVTQSVVKQIIKNATFEYTTTFFMNPADKKLSYHQAVVAIMEQFEILNPSLRNVLRDYQNLTNVNPNDIDNLFKYVSYGSTYNNWRVDVTRFTDKYVDMYPVGEGPAVSALYWIELTETELNLWRDATKFKIAALEYVYEMILHDSEKLIDYIYKTSRAQQHDLIYLTHFISDKLSQTKLGLTLIDHIFPIDQEA